jgi:hypothetical protein
MQIDSGVLYRSIPGSNELTFLFEASFGNVTGISNIGFSKNSELETIIFKFESGKIFDYDQNHVWSYNPNEIISISGNLGNDFLNYFIQGTPVCLYTPFRGDYYNNFLIETDRTPIDFDLTIQGLKPSYSINFPYKIPVGQDVTGYISNLSEESNKTFKIFSGDLFNAGGIFGIKNEIYPELVNGLSSGNIILDFIFGTGRLAGLAGTVVRPRLFLRTNFGNISQDFEMQFTKDPIYYLEFLAGFTGLTFIDNNNTSGYFYNYELRSIIPKPETVSFSVYPIYGNTGEVILDYYEATGFASGSFSGFVYGFDYLSGNLKGDGKSSNSNFYGVPATGSFDNIIQNRLFYATGNINYEYDLPFYGGFAVGFPSSGTKINAVSLEEEEVSSSEFIFKSRNIDFSSVTALSGIYNDVVNTGIGTGFFNKNIFYTGFYCFNLDERFWSPPSSGVPNIPNIQEYDKYVLVENKYISGFIYSGESGVADLKNKLIFSESSTGTLLRHVIPQSLTGSNITITASENTNLVQNLFIEKDLRNISDSQSWTTSENQTGYIRIEFKDELNVSPVAKYYEIGLDYNSSFYPLSTSLKGSQNLTTWVTLDSRIYSDSELNNNWYSSSKKYFRINDPKPFKYLQYEINESKKWPHKNYVSGSAPLLNIDSFYLYDSIDISLPANVNDFIPNLNSYSNNDGEVIFSKDYNPFLAWRAFTKNELTDMAVLSKDGAEEDIFLGYEKNNIFNNYLTGYYIEFLENYKPSFLSIEVKKPNREFIEYYRKSSDIDIIEKGKIYLPTGINSCRFVFKDVSPTSVSNFYPVLGEKDYDGVDGFGDIYLSYFNLILNNLIKNTSNSRKYYELKIGPCHFFVLDSDPITGGNSRCGLISEGAGKGESVSSKHNETYRSIQKTWFNNAISNSEYPFKFVLFNHPPFTSESYNYGYYDLNSENGWNLNSADIIFNGFSKNYERFEKRLLEKKKNIYYIVNGAGGNGLRNFSTPLDGSVKRIKRYGWTKLDIYAEGVTVGFIDSENNSELDSLAIGNIYGNLLYRYALVGNFNYLNKNSNDSRPPDYDNPLSNNFYTRKTYDSIQFFRPTCFFSIGNQGFF